MSPQIQQCAPPAPERADRDLHAATRPFAGDASARSWAYIGSTFGLLAIVLGAAAIAPWRPLRLTASMLGALLLVRAFILYHDTTSWPASAPTSGTTPAGARFATATCP